MIIDAHAHCDVRFGWVHTPEVLLRIMDEGGIDQACITGLANIPGDDAESYPRFLAALRAHPKRIVAGYLRLNPWYRRGPANCSSVPSARTVSRDSNFIRRRSYFHPMRRR